MPRRPCRYAEIHSSRTSSSLLAFIYDARPFLPRTLSQNLPELADRFVLYYLDVSLTLAHGPGRPRHRELRREAEGDDLALCVREALRGVHDLVQRQPVLHQFVRPGRVHSQTVRQWRRTSASVFLSPLADHGVVSDPEQPRREGSFTPLEAPYSLQHAHEDLFGQVLGVICVAHTGKDVAVYPGKIERVKLAQR